MTTSASMKSIQPVEDESDGCERRAHTQLSCISGAGADETKKCNKSQGQQCDVCEGDHPFGWAGCPRANEVSPGNTMKVEPAAIESLPSVSEAEESRPTMSTAGPVATASNENDGLVFPLTLDTAGPVATASNENDGLVFPLTLDTAGPVATASNENGGLVFPLTLDEIWPPITGGALTPPKTPRLKFAELARPVNPMALHFMFGPPTTFTSTTLVHDGPKPVRRSRGFAGRRFAAPASTTMPKATQQPSEDSLSVPESITKSYRHD